ncbi:chromosome segregation ATPase [Thermus oshimai JL-2]|uniref:Chromosome segregation ATPase n=1 Tax=Thermus oshimai JL-2 TaxID=751945 RepID=K7QWM2_THEOS|nr:chromosome segregation SMC family protein [Thermus oshimai]AFV75968.1 chromosome segregation ATPase [Thermus oshimai JL-2]
MKTWRLDRLVLQGFKSFAERTVLDFPDPVTGVIGPNGSGKSNLVEAIRFATGARAQELRGQELKAFLFQGGEGRPPKGFAEVRLELSRGAERLVVERRIEGERSQFRVNGRPLSAKALALHLSGTGLGRGGYAIVGQGEVGALLEAPEEVLLAHLEEAAGLRPVAEAGRATEERLKEALALLAAKEEALREKRGRLEALRGEAERARRARELALLALALKRSLLLARKEEIEAEMAEAKARLQALEGEERALEEGLRGLLERREALQKEEEALRERLEAVRLGLKEEEGLRREQEEMKRLLKALDRPKPEEPGPPPPAPTEAPEALKARLRALREEKRRLERERALWEEGQRRHLEALARYEERLQAFEEAQREKEALKALLQEKERTLGAWERAAEERRKREALLREKEAALKALRGERERLERLLASGADLQEGARRVRRLEGVVGVVADLLEAPRGLEVALEAALGPRLHWVLTEDEEAAKRAIALLKREGGRATFLPLTLLRPPPPPTPRPVPGLLGPAQALARLRVPGGAEAVLRVLFGDTLVFQDLDSALAYLRSGGRERLVTLEGEVLERSGAISGGRLKGGGEVLLLRGRVRALKEEEAQLEGEVEALKAALAQTPAPPLLELKGEVAALRARLSAPLPPRPTPPSPPPAFAGEARLKALEEELPRLEEALEEAEAHARWRLLQKAWEEWARLREEKAKVEARLAELGARLEGYAPLREEAQRLEGALGEVRRHLALLREEEAKALTRKNALLAERERLALLLARREATLEEVERELSELPGGERIPGSSRALAQRLAQTEREREALGPVNALAEGELARLEEALAGEEKEVAEATEALLRLEAEAKAVEAQYQEELKRSFARFQEAFRGYGEALLGAKAEVRREGKGLRLFLLPQGKRVQDLRLLSLGEKTLGALAFLFALGELQGGLPLAILDEVDAALDEANLHRFARFLASGRQFILVTHQKRTMEACHALYGVTSEGGVSRVYSIRKEVAYDA